MDDLADLPPDKRAKRYREMANEADRFAANTSGDMKTAYIQMAEQWRKLADDIEKK